MHREVLKTATEAKRPEKRNKGNETKKKKRNMGIALRIAS
jgi:hypothetical protein